MIAVVRSALLILIGLCGCANPFFEGTVRLQDTRDINGPYVVTTVAVGVETGDRIELLYNVVDEEPGNFIPLVMFAAEDDNGAYEGELFSRGIPGQLAGSEIRYYLAIIRGDEVVADDPVGGDLRPFVFSVLP